MNGVEKATVQIKVQATPIRILKTSRSSVTIEYNGRQHVLREGQDLVVDLTLEHRLGTA